MFVVETFSHSQSLGSDRLRKAIERNRAKQAKRETIQMSRGTSEATWSSSAPSPTPERPTIAQNAEQVRFSSSLRQGPKKPPAPVSYSKRSTALVKAKPAARVKTKRRSNLRKPLNVNDTVVKAFWAVCGVLVLRLIFSQGGVVDYYDRQEVLNERNYEKSRLEIENQNLRAEIELIKSNSAHQKKLVREHLGFIASDEFLILFAKDSKVEVAGIDPRS